MAATDSDTQPSGTTPGGVVEFLLERIAEDEVAAQAALNAAERGYGWASVDYNSAEAEGRGSRFRPERVLAECAAKRVAVIACQEALAEPRGVVWPPRVHMMGMADGLLLACRYLAAAYAGHPDYQPEWRP